MAKYRVVADEDPSTDLVGSVVEADTPEQAARMVLGLELTRSGRTSDRRAIVHFDDEHGSGRVVRLYLRAKDRILYDF